MLRRFGLGRVLPLAALLLIGCKGTEASPIAGIWSATTFMSIEVGKPQADVLAQGGGLTITVSSTNRTTGSLSIPATVTGGAAVVANMVGTATVIGGAIVQFDQEADTFVRDVIWTITGNTLVSSSTFSGVRRDITLTRQQF